MPEDDLIKIISSIGVNYQPAIQSAQEFAKSLENLNVQLEKIKRSATVAAGEINEAFSKTGRQFVADGEKLTRVISQRSKEAVQTTQQQLAKLESSLVSTAQRMQKLGVTVPGLSAQIAEVRGLRDQLTTGRQLSEEQQKAVAAATEYAIIQANNAKTLEREVKILTDGVKAEEMRTDSVSRRQMAEIRAQQAINKQWDEYLAKQKAAEERLKQQQMEEMWRAQAKAEAETARALEAKTREEIRYYDAMLAAEALQKKQAAEAARMLPLIEAQVAATQNKLQVEGLSNSQLAQQANIIRQQVTELQRRLAVEGKLTEVEVAQVNTLKQQAATLNANVRTALADLSTQQKIQRELTKQHSILASQVERRISWFMAGAGFFGIINTMRQMVEAAGDVEMGMVQIGRVMEDSSFQVEKMRKALLDLGIEYGTSWKDVQDIALRWAQAGYGVADTLELTRASLLALNTAELNAQQAKKLAA